MPRGEQLLFVRGEAAVRCARVDYRGAREFRGARIGGESAQLWLPIGAARLVAPAGSGKTVLSRALVNWIDPPLAISSGEVVYKSRNILDLPPVRLRQLRKKPSTSSSNLRLWVLLTAWPTPS